MESVLSLEYRVALTNLLRILWLECKFFAAEDDALEQEDVIFAVDVGLGYDENVFEQEFAEIGDVVTLPVLDSTFEISDGLHIFSSALSLVDLVCDAFGG